MVSIVRLPLLLCILFIASAVVPARSGGSSAHGDSDRKAILDALRLPVEKRLKKKVVFKVDHLKVKNGWAFMRGVPQQSDGSPMSYRGTVYQEAIDEGLFDDWICALLRKKGGKWRVVQYAIGATDVPYEPWPEEYGAPEEIFTE